MVARRHHPRHGPRDRLVLPQEQVPGGGVVGVRRPARSAGVRVADVAGVQMEGGLLAQHQIVVGVRRPAHALVAEGREHEAFRTRGCRAEGGDGRAAGGRGGLPAVVADAVVVRRAGCEAVHGRVHVVLLQRGPHALHPGRVQRADLGRDPAPEVVGAQADPRVRPLHRRRHLPGDPHPRPWVGAEGEMPAERGQRRAGRPRAGRTRHRAGRGAAAGQQAARHRTRRHQRAAAHHAAAQVLVLLGHAQPLGERAGDADVGSVHVRNVPPGPDILAARG